MGFFRNREGVVRLHSTIWLPYLKVKGKQKWMELRLLVREKEKCLYRLDFRGLTYARLHEGPSTHVFRFFLTPHDICIFEMGSDFGNLVPREWGKLLNADNCYILDASLFALRVKLVKYFARTENYSPNIGGIILDNGVNLSIDTLKFSLFSHVSQGGSTLLLA
jgi:hypothetical protein